MNNHVLIVTFCHRDFPVNYGQTLQAYALYQKIKDFGFQPLTASYTRRTNKTKLWYEERFFFPDLKTDYSKAFNKVTSFTKKHMKVVQCYDEMEVFHFAELCDILICGGDAIWRVEHFDPVFYLAFADPGKLRISYAASMVSYLEEKKDIYRKIFTIIANHLDYISSRESMPISLISEVGGRSDAMKVCDPVFLHPENHWADIAAPVPIDQPYVLTYLFDDDGEYEDALSEVCKQFPNRVVYSIATGSKRDGRQYYDGGVGIGEFIYLIMNCDALVTNSFHGTAFGLIFKKEIYVYERRNMALKGDIRLSTLLGDIGLESRLFKEADSISSVPKIDYSKVDEKLRELEIVSEKYLRTALSDAERKK